MDRNIFPVLTEVDLKLPFYVTSTGGWNNQELISREAGYPDYQWIQCIRGQGVLQSQGHTYTVSQGQGMLLFPDQPHLYRPVSEPWEVSWIAFNGGHVGDALGSLGFSRTQVLYISNPDLTLAKLREAMNILNSKNPMRGLEVSALVYEFILDLYKYTSNSEIRSKQQHFDQLSPILSYIEDHYTQALSLQNLADQIRVSPQYTCLLFQQTLGVRPFEYITRFRMRKAKELLLREIHMEINQIAAKVGYDHPSYFIKIFKKHEGVTPTIFRKIHRVPTGGSPSV
jgi:AraC family transcriptional regulator of arabinose operon